MDQHLEISVIIPVYNAFSTLQKCIDSVITQTFTEWELILVDDGSTDDSVPICRRSAEKDNRIVVLEQPHKGVSAARNLALDRAKGKYVCFIDSDDFVEPNYLSEIYALHNFDMVICGYYVDVYKDDNIIRQEQHLPENVNMTTGIEREILLPLFMSGMININCNKLLHLDIIRKNNLKYKAQPVNEDYMFMLSYLQHAQSVATINCPLYHWNRVEGIKSGVDSMPDNLLELYNEAHQRTRYFFCNDEVADKCLYYSYNYIVLKYFTAYSEGHMSRDMMDRKLNEFHQNNYVKDAYAAYHPQSKGEWIMHSLQKYGWFKTYYWLKSHI